LDAVDMALGKELQVERWFESGSQSVANLALSSPNLRFEIVENLPSLINSSTMNAFIFGHPLWSCDESRLVPIQSQAASKLRESGYAVTFVSLFELDRSPIKLQIKLNEIG
jgi:hypothetical protein